MNYTDTGMYGRAHPPTTVCQIVDKPIKRGVHGKYYRNWLFMSFRDKVYQYRTRSTWYLVPSTRYLVPSTWLYLVPGTRCSR